MMDARSDARVARRSAVRDAGADAGHPGWWGRMARSFLDRVGIVALGLVVVQGVWRASMLVRGHFTQSDYTLLLDVQGVSPGWSFLTSDHLGDFSPVGRMLAWVTVAVGGAKWDSVVVVVLVLQAVAALLLWGVLGQVLEQRWIRLPLFAVALLSPLTLPTVMSWSLATTYLPTAVLFLLGLSAMLSDVRDRWEPGPLLAGVSLTLLVLTSGSAALLPVVVLVVVAAMLPAGGTVRGRLRSALVRWRVLWAVLAVAVVGRVVTRVMWGPGFSFSAADPSPARAVGDFLEQGFAGVVAGPWKGEVRDGVIHADALWPAGVGVMVLVVLTVTFLEWWRIGAVRLLAGGFVAYVVLGAGLVASAGEDWSARLVAPRLLTDSVAVAVVVAAVALRHAFVPEAVRRPVVRMRVALALLLTTAFMTSTWITTRAVEPQLLNEDDRAFFAEMRKGVAADPRIVLLDGPVPEGLLDARFGELARVSTLARLLPQRPPVDVPSEHLRMVDGLGILRVVEVEGAESAAGVDGGCGHSATPQRSTIALSGRSETGPVVIEIAYLTGEDAHMVLELPDRDIRVPVRTGLHNVQIPAEGGFASVDVRTESVGDSVCIGQVRVGRATPAPFAGSE